MKLERFDESEQCLSEAFSLLSDSVGIEHARTKTVVGFLVEFYELRQQPDKALHWRSLLEEEYSPPISQ